MEVQAAAQQSWRAFLSLVFSGRESRTVIASRKHYGPLVIQKPFYPEMDVCHVYLLHPPGGVVGGDQLRLDVDVNDRGHALITTPAASKFYRSDGRLGQLQQNLRVESGSTLEWLPQETILFSASEVEMKTIVQLEAGSSFIGWEILCLGRPASDELYQHGSVRQNFEIWRHGQPLLLDRARFSGGDAVMSASWGMQGYNVSGTMMSVNADKDLLAEVRAAMPRIEQKLKKGLVSATLIDDVLVCRALGQQAENVRFAFIEIWKVIRKRLLDRPACEPRIWST